jgi:DnaJ-class molecular chaperone
MDKIYILIIISVLLMQHLVGNTEIPTITGKVKIKLEEGIQSGKDFTLKRERIAFSK